MSTDIVYAIHDFEAENPDELSFKAGERIIVIERDDLYQDGWWQGENIRGDRGLFPQTYTNITSTESAHDAAPRSDTAEMQATIDQVQSHLDEINSSTQQEKRRSNEEASTSYPQASQTIAKAVNNAAPPLDTPTSDAASLTSQDASLTEDDDLNQGSAKANLMRNVEKAKEKEARKRMSEQQAREAERERMARNAPPIDGLLLSDESEEEADHAIADDSDDDALATRRNTAVPGDMVHPDFRKSTTDITPQLSAVNRFSDSPSNIPLPETTTHSRNVSGAEPTIASLIRSSDGPAEVLDPPNFLNQVTSRPSPGLNADSQTSVYRLTPPVQSEQYRPLGERSMSGRDILADATTANHAHENSEVNGNLTKASEYSVSSPPQGSALRSPPPLSYNYTEQAPSPPSAHANIQQSTSTAYQTSTDTSSRHSSALGSASTPATTGYEHSPRSPMFSGRGHSDPREWSIQQVVEWGQSKGFDAGILAKFEEHEISGDVLVDMDINSLKEIDIIAFGPRARIAKAIKELRSAYEPPSSLSAPGSADSGSLRRGSQQFDRFSTEPIPENEALDTRSYGALGFQSSNSPHGSIGMGRTPSNNTATPRSSHAPNDGDVEELQPASAGREQTSSSEMPRQRSSIGSAVTGALGLHSKQKSVSSQHSADPDKDTKTSKGLFSGTIGRGRKPPPKYNTSTDLQAAAAGTDATPAGAPQQRQPSIQSSPSNSRFGGRFFSGNSPSQSGTSPSQNIINKAAISGPVVAEDGSKPQRVVSQASVATAVPSAAGGAVSPVPGAAKRDVRAAPTPPLTAGPTGPGTQTPLQRIGKPDYAGYLRKKGETYSGWKDRYLILKGHHLYIMKQPADAKIKGWIDLTGYRFISDGTVGGGFSDKTRYGFKAVHDKKAAHYFAASESSKVRDWMKALMKATIGRDYSAPVTSSANIKTIPLAQAQAMNPPPRPPSPTSAARVQKASLTGTNPNTLSPSDAAKLMGAAVTPSSPPLNGSAAANKRRSGSGFLPPLRTTGKKRTSEILSQEATPRASISAPSTAMGTNDRPFSTYSASEAIYESYATPVDARPSPVTAVPPSQRADAAFYGSTGSAQNPDQATMDWVNDHLPMGTAKALDWNDFGSGRLFTRCVEHLSGKSSGIKDSEFDKFTPMRPGMSPDMSYVDTLFSCFDFLLDRGINTESVSVNDLLTCNAAHMAKLGEAIRTRFDS